jgi:8-oxo-dGTP pyrophosphatase MutT (NUDIX family)
MLQKLTSDADLPQRLARALATGERGGSDGSRMSPQLSYGRHSGPAPHTARAAAVLVLLFRRGGRWHIPLTERPLTLAHHGGQMSLPGGAIDVGETSDVAAVRELEEELGIEKTRDKVELIGRLADCYVFASDFMITPWLAATAVEPEWRPHAHEVQSVVELPLETLLAGDSIGRLTIERGPIQFHAPCIRIGTHRVWGATCVILNELAGVVKHIAENG